MTDLWSRSPSIPINSPYNTNILSFLFHNYFGKHKLCTKIFLQYIYFFHKDLQEATWHKCQTAFKTRKRVWISQKKKLIMDLNTRLTKKGCWWFPPAYTVLRTTITTSTHRPILDGTRQIFCIQVVGFLIEMHCCSTITI